MEMGQIFGINEIDKACNYAKENGYKIAEKTNNIGERIFQIIEKNTPNMLERISDLRSLREDECFAIINRGQVWYENLNEQQINELKRWYQSWLNVTETLIIPTKPMWLK